MIFLCYLVQYNHLDPYASHNYYCTILVKGLKHMSTAKMWYSSRPYTDCKVYGHSHIQYS